MEPNHWAEHVEAITEHTEERAPCAVCRVFGGPQNVVLSWGFALVFGCVNFIPRGFVVVVMHRSERSAPADPQSGGSPPCRA